MIVCVCLSVYLSSKLYIGLPLYSEHYLALSPSSHMIKLIWHGGKLSLTPAMTYSLPTTAPCHWSGSISGPHLGNVNIVIFFALYLVLSSLKSNEAKGTFQSQQGPSGAQWDLVEPCGVN